MLDFSELNAGVMYSLKSLIVLLLNTNYFFRLLFLRITKRQIISKIGNRLDYKSLTGVQDEKIVRVLWIKLRWKA